MKCWKCGNELTTGDAPNSAQCRRCEQASISSSPASAGSAVRFSLDPESGFVRDHAAGEWLTTAEEVFDAMSPLLPNK